MKYKIKILPTARRELLSLSEEIQKRIYRKIAVLAADPYPKGVKAIKGGDGIFRLRVGDYRVLYQVKRNRLLVLVLRIGHRKDIYRR